MNPGKRQVTISVLVNEKDARDLLIELAEDERVVAVSAEMGGSRYLVPVRTKSAPRRDEWA